MDVELADARSGDQGHFNGAVPMKRAQRDLTSTSADAAQVRKRKEAEKAYGRGRKIPCRH
jgi:U3 small nucleolar RNA-associated protein 7